MPTSRARLLLVLPCLAIPAAAAAQSDGAFRSLYPEAHALVLATEAVQERILDRLATELVNVAAHMPIDAGSDSHMDHMGMETEMAMASAREQAIYDELLGGLRTAADGTALPAHTRATEASGVTERLRGIVAHAHDFQRTLLDIHADASVTDKVSAVEAAMEVYASDRTYALPATPKSMELLHTHRYARTFGTNFPWLRGMVWTGYWLQYASFEPLFLLDTTEQRRAGLATVADRFWRKLQDPPEAHPLEMPMVPTIAPGLRARYPEISAVFDNLNILLSIVNDVVLHEEVTDKRAAVEELIEAFVDPAHEVVTQYDWTLMALRHGIFNQGGPALGTLTRSERNRPMMDHSEHGSQGTLPGMPGG